MALERRGLHEAAERRAEQDDADPWHVGSSRVVATYANVPAVRAGVNARYAMFARVSQAMVSARRSRRLPPMRDPRSAKLAHVIVHHSTRLQPGEAVLIEAFDLQNHVVLDLIEAVHDAEAIPVVSLRNHAVIRQLLRRASETQLAIMSAIELQQMQQVQAYVGIRASANVSETSDVPGDRMALYQRIVSQPVHLDYRVKHTRWVVLR